MTRLASAALGVLAVCTALAPASAIAQTATDPATAKPAWRFQIQVGGTWDENPRFRSAGDEAAWSTSGQASLSHQRPFRRGSFSISAFGGRAYYPEIPDLNLWTYGGAGGLTWTPTRRGQLTLTQSYTRSNTRRLESLDAEGLPVPTTGVDTAKSALSFSQGLSRRLTFEIDGDFTWRRYDASEIVGGEQLDAGARMVRSVGRYGSLYVGYDLSSSWVVGREGRVHVVRVGGRAQPARGFGLDLGGGLAYIENRDQYLPTGRAGLSLSGRRISAQVLYRRFFGLAFGYGRLTIADLVSAGLGFTPTPRLSLSAAYTFGNRRDPADDSFRVRSHVASGSFTWSITERLSFAARYSWLQNRTSGFPGVNGGRATASLSYGVDWR